MAALRRHAQALVDRRQVFRREGNFWTVAWDDVVVRLKDNRGLQYLAQLLARPARRSRARPRGGRACGAGTGGAPAPARAARTAYSHGRLLRVRAGSLPPGRLAALAKLGDATAGRPCHIEARALSSLPASRHVPTCRHVAPASATAVHARAVM